MYNRGGSGMAVSDGMGKGRWGEVREEHNVRHLCKMSLIAQKLKFNVNRQYPALEILPTVKGPAPMQV